MKKQFYFLVSAIFFFLSFNALSLDFISCKKTSDCVLVKDSYCSNISAVNKKLVSQWKAFDIQDSAEAHKTARTCTPLPATPKIEDYKAECIQNNCSANRTKPWKF